jgi:cystathionine gamma-synthase
MCHTLKNEQGEKMSNESLYPNMVEIDGQWSEETVAVQAGRPERIGGAPMNVPLTFSSTYVHDTNLGYARDGNQSWGALETVLGSLEGGVATTFSSGLAAATAIADLVPTGGVVVLPASAYYGVKNIFFRLESQARLTTRIVDMNDTEAVIRACAGAAMVWAESIANPQMVVADIPAIASAAKKAGALTVVDATFASPLRQKPLEMGADIVLHSATKLIGGHSDILLGAAIAKSPEHAQFFVTHRHDFGAIPGNMEAFLALRGLRTLAVRLDRAEASAQILAERLAAHPGVTVVNYSGLPSDSQHEKATRVLPHGSGNMLSFEINAQPEAIDRAFAKLQVITHATSLGGVESLIERRARWQGERDAGVPLTLCRFSVGIENLEDLWRDLNAAINAASK